MAGLDEFLIGAYLKERPLSKLPWESSDGEKTENQEREGSPKHQQVEVVEEKAWNDWSTDTKQPEEHRSYGLQGKSSVDDGSIVSKEFGDEIMAKVTLGELSMTEILYGHGYKEKSEPKQPVDERKIVDIGFEDAFTRGNLDTSYAIQSEISDKPSFLRETSSTKNPSCLDITSIGTLMSFSPTRSAFNDNPSQIIDVGFTELPKTPKFNMPKMLSANEIVDVGLDPLGPSIFGMNSPPRKQSGLSIESYSDAKLSAIISKQRAMPWDENEWETKQIKRADCQIAEFQNGRLYSDNSCFDKAHSTIATNLVFDEYKPFRPDVIPLLENRIDFASSDVGYAPSFSNSDTSDRNKADTNIRSVSDSNYVGVKKTIPSNSLACTGKVPNLKSDSAIHYNDLRNTCNTNIDPSVESCYSKPPVVNTASFRLSSSSYSNTQYDNRSDQNSATMYYCNPADTTKTTQEVVTIPDIVPAKHPSSMSVTMEMKDTNLTYDEYQPFRRDIRANLENSNEFANHIADVGYVPSFSDSDVSDRNNADTNIHSVKDRKPFSVNKTSPSYSSAYNRKVPNLMSESSVSYNDLRNACKPITETSVEPCYTKPPVVNTAHFRLSSPSYSNTQYDKRLDSNSATMYYGNPTHTANTTQEVITRPDIFPAKQPSSMSETMEMKDTNLSHDEYKPFRSDIKDNLEDNIDFANPITDVGYVPSFSDSDVSDRNKADTNIQSFSDGNYFGVKKTSPSNSSAYTGKVPKLKSETSIFYNDLRSACKTTTDTSVEPGYTKHPVVDTASFRLSSPSYSNTQYDKRSDQNCGTMYYSNPTHTARTTQEVVTRPDIVPAKQPSSMSVTMKTKDTNLTYDEYKSFRQDIKANLEDNIDLANPITVVGYVPSFSDSDVSDRNKEDTNSLSDGNYFGVKKTSTSNSSAYTVKVPKLKLETSISYNDLRNACKTTTYPSVEPCYSKPPVVDTAIFRLSPPSYSNTQYDKRSDPNIATMYSSNPTDTTKATYEVTRPDIVTTKQDSSMLVTLGESKQASEWSNQSRSSASVHKVSTERNICNAFGKTISIKESETSTNQRSNPPTGSNAIKSWLVKSIESDDDVNEFETETATHYIPVSTNKLNKDILRTSDIETKLFGFKSNNKDVKPSYVNTRVEDVKPKVFNSNTIAVQPAGVKTCITIVNPKDTKANTSGMKSLDLNEKVKTVKPARVRAKEYAPLRYQPKSHALEQEHCQLNTLKYKQNPNSNSYTATPSTSKVNPGHKLALPKVSKVIVVEPEHVKRERRKKKIERMIEMIPTDIDVNMVRNQYNTDSNTLPNECKPVGILMDDVRKQYVSDGNDDTYQMNEVAGSRGFKEEDTEYIDYNTNKTYTQIMNDIKNLGCKKESKKSSPKRVKCGTKLCAAKKKVSFAKLDELSNTHSVNDLCKRCKRELSQSNSRSHTTKNKSAVKTINTDKTELEVPRQQLESQRNGPIPSDVYYQLIDIVERNIGAEQRRSLMRSTSIAGLLDIMHGRSYTVEHDINNMADPEDHAVTGEHIDSLFVKNELKTENGTLCNSVKEMVVANDTVSCLTGISEQIDKTDVSYGHDTDNNEAKKDGRKISKGRKFIKFMKRLFCCKRKNKAVDVDD